MRLTSSPPGMKNHKFTTEKYFHNGYLSALKVCGLKQELEYVPLQIKQ